MNALVEVRRRIAKILLSWSNVHSRAVSDARRCHRGVADVCTAALRVVHGLF